MKRRGFPIYMLASVYLYIVVVVLLSIKIGLTSIVFETIIISHIVLVIIVYIPNLVNAILLIKSGTESNRLLFWSMLLKLLFIPVYCAVFMLGFITSINPMTWIFTLLFIIFDYSLLIPSSMYAISGLIIARRNSIIDTKTMVFHILLHTLFVFDVLSSIYMFRYCIKMEKDDDLSVENS